MELPEATSYFWKQGRLQTFSNWPFKTSDKCNSECMATAGFYVIGDNDEIDLVECFMCGKQLDGWEPTDDPWNEHLKHQPDCPFVKLNKQNENEWTIIELFDLYRKYKTNELMQNLTKTIAIMKDKAAEQKKELLALHKISRKNKKSTY